MEPNRTNPQEIELSWRLNTQGNTGV